LEKRPTKTVSDFINIDHVPFFGRMVCISFIVIGLLIYSTSLSNPFIWDDFDLIVENPNIRGWSHILDVFKGNVVPQSSFYRPVQMFSYLFDYEIFGLNPKGFHFTSILIHIAVSLSLCWFCVLLFRDRTIGLISGLLFLIHPVHNEAVVYISGRADLLVALFILFSLIYYIKYDQNKNISDFIACVGFSILALLSKEYALILPGFLLLIHYAFGKKNKAHLFYIVTVLCIVYFILRMFNIVGVADMHSKTQTIFLQRLPGSFYAVLVYLRLLVLPYDLFLGYGQKFFYWNDLWVWAGLIVYFLFFFIVVFTKGRNQKISFLIGWFLFGLLPVMNFYPINAYMAEHWIYIPSMGLFILAAYGIKYIHQNVKTKDFVYAGCGLIFIILSLLTVRQNLYWKDPIAFYKRIIEINPEFVKAYNNLGKLYTNAEDYNSAAYYFKKTFEIDPRFEKGYHNYAVCLTKQFKYDEAIGYYNKALSLNPNFAPTYNNLGALYIDLKNYDLAEQYVNKALNIKSDIPKAYYNLGLIEKGRGNEIKAIEYFNQALKYDASYTAAKNNLAAMLINEGNPQYAIQQYEEILQSEPNNHIVINNLGILYGKDGDIDKSIEYFIKALKIKPDYADAHFNIAYAFARKNSIGQAMRHYQDALRYNPQHIQAINNLAIIYASQGRNEDAKQLFLKAIQLDENDESAHNNLGLVLSKLKEFDKAIEHYQKALVLNPNYKEAHNNLAMLYDATGKMLKAEEHYNEALKLDPNFTNALNGLGIVYGKEKRYKEAEMLFLKALEINPGGKDAQNNLQRARYYMQKEGI